MLFRVVSTRRGMHTRVRRLVLMVNNVVDFNLYISYAECLTQDHQLPVLFTRDNVLHVGLVAEVRVLVLGLDGVGKTALINQAKHLFMTPDSGNASLTRAGRAQGVVWSQFNVRICRKTYRR